MKRWIVLLRGINVGGNNILPMQKLRSLLVDAGYENVRTYIQSGNCVLDAQTTSVKTLVQQVAECIEVGAGFTPTLMALSAKDLQKAVDANPYAAVNDAGKCAHLFFLASPAKKANTKALEAACQAGETFTLTTKVFYLHAPNGIGRSKIAAKAEQLLGVPVTARNLRSAQKILELAQSD